MSPSVGRASLATRMLESSASEWDPCLPRVPGDPVHQHCHHLSSFPGSLPPPALGDSTVSPSVPPPLPDQLSPGVQPGFVRDGCRLALRNSHSRGVLNRLQVQLRSGTMGSLLPAAPSGGDAGAKALAEPEAELLWLWMSHRIISAVCQPLQLGLRPWRGPSCVGSCRRAWDVSSSTHRC